MDRVSKRLFKVAQMAILVLVGAFLVAKRKFLFNYLKKKIIKQPIKGYFLHKSVIIPHDDNTLTSLTMLERYQIARPCSDL